MGMVIMKRYLFSFLVVLSILVLSSCSSTSKPTATPVTPSPSPVLTLSPTPSPTPIATPTPTLSATPRTTTPTPPKISPSTAKTILETDPTSVFVDVRAKTDYDKQHIPGAISIPSAEFQERYTEIPAALQIIVYSGCFG